MHILPSSFSFPLGGDPLDGEGVRMSCILEQAAGKGEVTLASADPHVQPYLYYGFLEEPFDRERLREAVRLCFAFAYPISLCTTAWYGTRASRKRFPRRSPKELISHQGQEMAWAFSHLPKHMGRARSFHGPTGVTSGSPFQGQRFPIRE